MKQEPRLVKLLYMLIAVVLAMCITYMVYADA